MMMMMAIMMTIMMMMMMMMTNTLSKSEEVSTMMMTSPVVHLDSPHPLAQSLAGSAHLVYLQCIVFCRDNKKY